MKLFRAGAMVAVTFVVSGCGRSCDGLTRDEAFQIAREAKAGMLQRSTDEYAANFKSEEAVFVRVGSETNGYAANVGFEGRNGTTLIALIESDCYVGWTKR